MFKEFLEDDPDMKRVFRLITIHYGVEQERTPGMLNMDVLQLTFTLMILLR